MNILHLADLHFGSIDDAHIWYNQLAEDLTKELHCKHLDALVLSGDIANSSVPDEYAAAELFLDSLCKEFVVDSDKVILVPGNHDLNWDLSREAYRPVSSERFSGADEDRVIRVVDDWFARDESKYRHRFRHFSRFYQNVIGEDYPLAYERQYTLKYFPETNLLILGLNSAWELDHHFRSRVAVNQVALSSALTDIRSNSTLSQALKIAVWHHPIHSSFEDRIKDYGFLEQLAKAGFRFALHGHVHKAETTLFKYDHSAGGRQIEIISAGTFGAPTRELTPAYPWQYNLLRLDLNKIRVETRRREEINGAWKPDARWLSGPRTEPSPYYEIAIHEHPPSAGSRIRRKRQDWENSPTISGFYGRKRELLALNRWALRDNIRLIGIWGIGGVGKSDLAKMLAQQIQPKFDFVIWRTLLNAPPVEELLSDLLQFLSEQRVSVMLPKLRDQLPLLISLLTEHRCLLILDNLEAVFQERETVGFYRSGFEGYGELVRLLGQGSHRSCVLLTSREMPREFVLIEGKKTSVRSLTLYGLGTVHGRQMLKHKGLVGTNDTWKLLVERFSGNPQFLKIVAGHIRKVFGGDISSYLNEEQPALGAAPDLFNQQFSRLTPLEQEIMYWLAIERAPISRDKIRENIIHSITKRSVLEALESLLDRFMIEPRAHAFTLQNVVMEYVTDRLCAEMSEDIQHDAKRIFDRHALMMTSVRDNIRNSQIRLILQPIVDQLLDRFKNVKAINAQLLNILASLKGHQVDYAGYAAGNILNLCWRLGVDLSGCDFSYQCIREAYLPDINLHDTNFSYSKFWKCSFLETFNGILSVAINTSGSLLATGDASGEICVWDIRDCEIISRVRAHSDWVRAIVFARDDQTLYSCSDDQSIRKWNFRTGQCLMSLHEHTGRVRTIDLSPNGQMLVSGSDDCTVRLWDTTTGGAVNILKGHSDHIRAAIFSPEGSIIATGSEDLKIKIWETQTGRCVKTLEDHTNWVCALAFSPDGHYLISGGEDRTTRLWHVRSGRCLQVFRGHNRWVWSVAFSPQGQVFASGSGDQSVKLWDLANGLCLRTLSGHSNWVRSLTFSADGQSIFSGSDDRTLRIWNVDDGECIKILHGYAGWIYSVASSEDGEMLAYGGEDRTIKVWSIRQGKLGPVLRGHRDWIWSIAFSPNSKLLASASGDQSIHIWDVTSGARLKTLEGHEGQVRCVVFNKQGTVIATGSDDRTIRLWDVNTGACLAILHGHSGQVGSLAFRPDGRLLASGSEDTMIKIWDVHSGDCLSTLRGHERKVLSLAFSFAGAKLASGSEDRTVKIWDVDNGTMSANLLGHVSFIQAVSFAKDDKSLASAGKMTVREWDVDSRKCLNIAELPTERVRSVWANPESGFIACGSEGASLRIWDVNSRRLIRMLKSPKPYQGMEITGVQGLTEAQRSTLISLGAIEFQ